MTDYKEIQESMSFCSLDELKFEEIEKFLWNLSFFKIQCVCVMNNIYINGDDDIKSKLIVKISEKFLTFNIIKQKIEQSKKFKFIIESLNEGTGTDIHSYFSNHLPYEIMYKLQHIDGLQIQIFDHKSFLGCKMCHVSGNNYSDRAYNNAFYENKKRDVKKVLSGKLTDDTKIQINKIDSTVCDDLISAARIQNKKKTIPPKLKEKVWTLYLGNEISRLCPICEGTTISVFSFECAHVVSEFDGGQTKIENLRAICGSCNKSMGSKNMKDYTKEFYPGAPILSTFIL